MSEKTYITNLKAFYNGMYHYFDNKGTWDYIVGPTDYNKTIKDVDDLLRTWDKEPLFEHTSNLKALDFGCGPGRIMSVMKNHFEEVDGADISEILYQKFPADFAGRKYYCTDGNNLGKVPDNYYDFIYSMITFQHIPVHSVRLNILRDIHKKLKYYGVAALQFGYSDTYEPNDGIHFDYFDNAYHVEESNSVHDCIINRKNVPQVLFELGTIFDKVKYKLVPENPQRLWYSHNIFFYLWK
jgi:SAM-dependent methyltransferase